MRSRTPGIVWALRAAYLLGATLFVLDVVIGSVTAVDQLSRSGDIDENAPIASVMEWIALLAFCSAAAGALITVAARVRATKTPASPTEPATADH